jgi:hypothetical protein
MALSLVLVKSWRERIVGDVMKKVLVNRGVPLKIKSFNFLLCILGRLPRKYCFYVHIKRHDLERETA